MSNSKLRLSETILSWDDEEVTNNPSLNFVNWRRDVADIDVTNPLTEKKTLPAGTSADIFDGTRSTAIDGTSAFSVSLVLGSSDHYRFRWTGGTNPLFRTARALDLSAQTVTITVGADATATFTTTGSFASVQVGDTLWLPGADESITSPFHQGNQGFWTVVVGGTTSIVVTRAGSFEAAGGDTAVAVTAANQIQAFSAAGVQIGDKLVVSAGFVLTNRRTYDVVSVTSTYVEVISTSPIAAQTGILPGNSGFQFFDSARRYLRVEVDQECGIVLNAESTQRVISPWSPGDRKRTGWLEVCGATFSLTVVNRSPQTANVVVISAE